MDSRKELSELIKRKAEISVSFGFVYVFSGIENWTEVWVFTVGSYENALMTSYLT